MVTSPKVVKAANRYRHLPAPTKEELENPVMPWEVISVTPMFARPTAKMLLMVAICITDARRAALSDCTSTLCYQFALEHDLICLL